MRPTSELLKEWSDKPSGFVWVDGRGWVDVQSTARNYLADVKRMDEPELWEQSAGRFIAAVGFARRWCSNPQEVEVFETAVPAVPFTLPWKSKTRKRP